MLIHDILIIVSLLYFGFPEMLLTDNRRIIAPVPQKLHKSGFLFRQETHIARHAALGRVSPRKNSRPGRNAGRIGGISVQKAYALPCHRIQMRRQDLRIYIPHRIITLLVGHQEQNIRSFFHHPSPYSFLYSLSFICSLY